MQVTNDIWSTYWRSCKTERDKNISELIKVYTSHTAQTVLIPEMQILTMNIMVPNLPFKLK